MLFSILLLMSANTANATENTAELESKVKCTGLYRKVEKQNVTEKVEALVLVSKLPGIAKYELSLEGRFLSIKEDLQTGDLLAFIIHNENDTKGIATTGTLDSRGRFTTSDVDGNLVYKIVCVSK